MPKKQYSSIEAVVEEMEPGKRYIIFLDRKFLEDMDRDSLAELLEKRNVDNGSIGVIGDGDPQSMVHFMEADNWGNATLKLQDFAMAIAWPLPNRTGVFLEDFDPDTWADSMLEFFARKVDEARIVLKAEQESRRGIADATE